MNKLAVLSLLVISVLSFSYRKKVFVISIPARPRNGQNLWWMKVFSGLSSVYCPKAQLKNKRTR